MKLKKLLCVLLAAALCMACLTGCQGTDAPADPGQTEKPEKPEKPEQPVSAELLSAVTNAKNIGFSAFDNQLVEYLKQTGHAEENFTVSPLSFKAALTLAALGAEGETQTQLLSALGYQDLQGLRRWYATVLTDIDSFTNFYGKEGGAAAYRVVNSVWSNQDLPGEFRKDYLDDIFKTCRADASSASAARLADAVNAWVNEQTNGLIPNLLEDASDVSAVLVNALYLKACWDGSFTKDGEKDFTTRSGEKVQKTFMKKEDHVDYYEDENTQLVKVPLQGGISMVFVLGDDTDLASKLAKADYRLVDISVPMFDVETTLNQHELCDYLKLMGCEKMFTDKAEFDPMYTSPLFVGDIVQKAKVHIDEEGLEAAAATAILMCGAALPEPETPAVFCADRPFTFYVVTNGEAPELLFWGQIVK